AITSRFHPIHATLTLQSHSASTHGTLSPVNTLKPHVTVSLSQHPRHAITHNTRASRYSLTQPAPTAQYLPSTHEPHVTVSLSQHPRHNISRQHTSLTLQSHSASTHGTLSPVNTRKPHVTVHTSQHP
ncbi:MAG: hypothetical protein IJR63_09575, partial [Synergistaceae bacterium]|nr:hypothetical protein [Synergistaceae bacterium]